jgi:hypothetical protein
MTAVAITISRVGRVRFCFVGGVLSAVGANKQVAFFPFSRLGEKPGDTATATEENPRLLTLELITSRNVLESTGCGVVV